jgi:mannose-6-phosphate isomerase-like protein (cupin superfamily)
LPVAQLAVAAALLLALAASLLVLRSTTQSPVTNVLDAAQAPAVETFLDTVVENQAADWTPLSVERWTFQPGGAALIIPALTGPQWIVAEGDGLVVSIGGVERDLATDESLMIPTGQKLVLRNTGPAASSALRGVAVARYVFEEYDRSFITRQTALDTEAHEALPPGASHIVFERLTLLAGTTLLLEPATGQDWLDVASGRLGVTLLGKGAPLNWQSGREREVAADEMLPALVPGTKVTLRNVGDEPLVLLRLRVMSVAVSGAGASP